MKKMLDLEEAPLYVRWTPDSSTMSIELRLEVIARLQGQVEASESAGVEVGGVLLGRPAQESGGTLRVDDVLMIERRAEDGPIFMLDPAEHDRFLTTRWDAKTQGRAAVGFFRTHRRTGPLRLSLADRTLITGHFTKEAVAVLLVQGQEPHKAALFVGTEGSLPEDPSVPEFLFDEHQFRSLPEARTEPVRSRQSTGNMLAIWATFVVLLLSAAGAIYRYRDALPDLAIASSELGPSMRVSGTSMVTIAWNHSSTEVRKAASAKLNIFDGEFHREVELGPDELRLGSVEYRPQRSAVTVMLTLSMSDSTAVVQSVTWHNSSIQ